MLWCLGRFQPTELRVETLVREMREWLQSQGCRPEGRRFTVGVREPGALVHEDIRSWHRDGLGRHLFDVEKVPQLQHMLLWSNRQVTEFRELGQQERLERSEFQPGMVILVDNRRVEHRVPAVQAKDRWLIRVLEPKVPEELLERCRI